MLSRRRRISPIKDATSHILSSEDKPGCVEKFISHDKGKGDCLKNINGLLLLDVIEDVFFMIKKNRWKMFLIKLYVLSGRGVFATQPIESGSFILEYRGEFFPIKDCQKRKYNDTDSTFLFEFSWQNKRWW